MTPGARVAAAIAVLDRVLADDPAEACLTNWARGARYAGSKDRAAVRDHVFQALRCRRSYACLGGAATGRGLMIGMLRDAGTDPGTLFTGLGHAPPPLAPAERTAGAPPVAEGDRMDLPDWLVGEFRDSLGDDACTAARALRDRAPVMLRVNRRMNSVSQAIEMLMEDGIQARQADIADTAVVVTANARRVGLSSAYQEGCVELQDGSSQAAMARLHVPAGARVLDYCAGGGGKVLALAARADAMFLAHDADAGRMTDLPARARRAGVRVDILAPGKAAEQAPYDLVLCDVPCSGSGTWRRAPDAKWRMTPARLESLRAIQAEILRTAMPLVRPGGLLAYATCSVLRSENEAQIARFTAECPGWRVEEEVRWPIGPNGDGFFLAQLRNVGAGGATLTGFPGAH
ncbi:RsmB/NOP family class I SAM-dependent RNA methyltransferase [Roseovarius salis]|uniref:RsmB/NOP family class I SAM-dependent RNA methyltransferase n=1 Tax=Roseovarius salis TaxID=3376063 RepID=UPI0037C90354